VRKQVLEAAQSARPSLGFVPVVQFSGPVDSAIPLDVLPHLRAALREALANIARHAEATSVAVDLVVDRGHVTLTAVDNGKGMDPDGGRSGLTNLASRAKELGGDLTTTRPEAGGTKLEWSVPLPREPSG
jgi:signal transduction histidine kinase